MIRVGIDPGIGGAIAVLAGDGSLISVHDMPTMKLKKASRVNAASLARILADADSTGVAYAIVERVQSMPKQGIASTFSFGHAAGVIEGVLGALEIPYELVVPAVWKRQYGLLGTNKDASRAKAIQLYPDAPLDRKRDGGRADAILLARLKLEGQSKISLRRKSKP